MIRPRTELLEERFVPTNKQRREASRRHLERQLQARQEREARRKKATLITSILGTLVLIAAVIVAVIVIGKSDKTPSAAGTKSPIVSPTVVPTSSPSPTPTATPSTSYPPASGASVSFDAVTVKGAEDLKGSPGVTTHTSKPATTLKVKDLVVGTGQAATPTSTVTVQYVGVFYNKGTVFDSSWKRGSPTAFPLTGVVKGFTYGIGGEKGVAPMKVGGRRIIIVPPKLGYGTKAYQAIPANSSLVFVVDLKSING